MLPRLSPAIDHRNLFLSRYDRLLSRARTLLGSRVDLAPDLVHEAFVQFVSRQPALDAIDDVDAYLHRKEGDTSNAGYWYRRASRDMFAGSLDDEWTHITEALLEQ